MAQPTAVFPSSPLDGASLVRSNSRVSTASTGASLRRRSRTRTKTLTSRPRGKSLGRAEGGEGAGGFVDGTSPSGHFDDAPPLPIATPQFCDEPEELDGGSMHARASTPPGDQPPGAGTDRVERQPVRNTLDAAKASMGSADRARSLAASHELPPSALPRDIRSEGGPSRARLRGMSLPRPAFRNTGSSDSSAQPSPLTPADAPYSVPAIQVAGGERPNPRDSVLTQVSATSSSVYPASTSSGSCAESSVFPHSIEGHRDEESSFSPEIVSPGGSEFDPDDVSYRLRLLVNNNYFLPPAHNKPSPLALASQNNKRASTKPANSSFLDFFRRGRSKSKPTTPDAASPVATDLPAVPVLRTTSDSTTASGHVARPHARSMPPAPSHNLSRPPTATRVVVLREKMDDLHIAAREVEKEIKTRSHIPPREDKSEDDVIDPTDAVDLPLSSSYPFAVQASAVYGLNVNDPADAGVLAEHLPPPTSPGIWSTTSEEESWRKALLHEAVSLSLNNTPDPSFIATMTDPSIAPNSPTSPRESIPEQPVDTRAALKVKHHISRPILDDVKIRSELAELEYQLEPTEQRPPLNSRSLTAPARSPMDPPHSPWNPYQPPVRAETPHQPLPLSPAPRRSLINPVFSLSQPDLTESSRDHGSAVPSERDSRTSLQIVRKAVSSPGLSASRELEHSRSMLSITPPPSSHTRPPRGISPNPPESRAPTAFSSYRSAMSESRYSDDQMSFVTPLDTDAEQRGPRPSVTISLISEGRPSFDEYSHPSPTASAFQDALFGSCRSPSVLSRRSYVPEASPPSREPSPLPAGPPRQLAMSPPPRPSSSLMPTVLPPPPRPPPVKPVYRPSTSSRGSSDHVRRAAAVSRGPSMDTSSSPPLPDSRLSIAERRRAPSTSLSLRIPTEDVPPAIHSAPAPAPPTDFFDQLQSHPNAMDDLDTSDESDTEDTHDVTSIIVDSPQPAGTSSLRAPSTTSFTRLGNHSTPQFSSPPRPSDDLPPIAIDPSDRMKPIGNTPSLPPPGTYFASRKKGLRGISPVPSTEALVSTGLLPQSFSLSASPPPKSPTSPRRRPATANDAEGRSKRWQRESLQKFDGMLEQHIAAERDRMKRIASHISSASNRNPS
ncbi:hypothetical protein CERSUDRAFT_107879 [Gelatoporia subvermispora B]|uniref:Uncharacterized protein n=1 Tax=Ceriporiopsis subvermispora (strain B) TaxID=914234 RepID=M2R6Y3_CERS8|nr:hypothetical protein CERSUDRAFT_107879 [Gelatoporia subvermispora B]